MGWLGRLLGAALPPLAPPQFANGAVPPQFVPVGPQGQQNAAWAMQGQQQAPPGYAYVPYYPGHPNAPPQQLQAPPRGFYGPGGVFYAWNPEGQNLAQGQQAPAPQAQAQLPTQTDPAPVQPSGPSPSTAGPSTPSSVPANGTHGPAAGPTPTPTTTQQPSHASASESSIPSPREAAAQAALRRFNPAQAGSSSSSAQSRPADPATRESTEISDLRSDATPRPTAAQSTPSQQALPPSIASTSSNPVTQPTPTASTSVGSAGAVQSPPFASPPLIPLGQTPAAAVPNGYRPPSPRGLAAGPTTITPAQWAQRRVDSARQTQRNLEALRDLPAVLTEEQLGRLDTLTREAIDERLKVLESVSGTLWKCITELSRMRSALPIEGALRVQDPPSRNENPSTIADRSNMDAPTASSSSEGDSDASPRRAREQTIPLD